MCVGTESTDRWPPIPKQFSLHTFGRDAASMACTIATPSLHCFARPHSRQFTFSPLMRSTQELKKPLISVVLREPHTSYDRQGTGPVSASELWFQIRVSICAGSWPVTTIP